MNPWSVASLRFDIAAGAVYGVFNGKRRKGEDETEQSNGSASALDTHATTGSTSPAFSASGLVPLRRSNCGVQSRTAQLHHRPIHKTESEEKLTVTEMKRRTARNRIHETPTTSYTDRPG